MSPFLFLVEACAMLRRELCHMMVEVSSFAIRPPFSAVGSSENLLISLIAVTIQGNYQHIPSSSQLITMWGTPDFGENWPDVCFNIHPFLLWNAAHLGTLSWVHSCHHVYWTCAPVCTSHSPGPALASFNMGPLMIVFINTQLRMYSTIIFFSIPTSSNIGKE